MQTMCLLAVLASVTHHSVCVCGIKWHGMVWHGRRMKSMYTCHVHAAMVMHHFVWHQMNVHMSCACCHCPCDWCACAHPSHMQMHLGSPHRSWCNATPVLQVQHDVDLRTRTGMAWYLNGMLQCAAFHYGFDFLFLVHTATRSVSYPRT